MRATAPASGRRMAVESTMNLSLMPGGNRPEHARSVPECAAAGSDHSHAGANEICAQGADQPQPEGTWLRPVRIAPPLPLNASTQTDAALASPAKSMEGAGMTKG